MTPYITVWRINSHFNIWKLLSDDFAGKIRTCLNTVEKDCRGKRSLLKKAEACLFKEKKKLLMAGWADGGDAYHSIVHKGLCCFLREDSAAWNVSGWSLNNCSKRRKWWCLTKDRNTERLLIFLSAEEEWGPMHHKSPAAWRVNSAISQQASLIMLQALFFAIITSVR